MENLKYVFDELIVAKLIYSFYCLGLFTTVSQMDTKEVANGHQRSSFYV